MIMIRLYLSLPRLLPREAQRSHWLICHSRNFAVKELPWCSNSNSKQNLRNTSDSNTEIQYHPIERFGIIAAMSNNNIIGVKGAIPWNVTDDRKEFVRLTQGKVLIVGRKTFEEQRNLSHIAHAAKCIVISKSLGIDSTQSKIDTEVLVVRSFQEALDVARRVVNLDSTSKNDETDDIDCWIAGGQDIYYRFPPTYHWDNRFAKISERENITQDDKAIKFTQYIYKKKSFR